ncbi:MAG: hypothetical protein ACOYBQ_10305 [Fluviibacter sp.]
MTTQNPQSSPVPLDGRPLEEIEILALRQVLRDEDRTRWARKQLRVIAPAVVAIVTGVWSLWDWFLRHIKFTA